MKKIIYYIVFAIFFAVIIYLLRNRNIPNLTKSPYIVNQCEDVTMDVISLEGTFITVAIGYFAKTQEYIVIVTFWKLTSMGNGSRFLRVKTLYFSMLVCLWKRERHITGVQI